MVHRVALVAAVAFGLARECGGHDHEPSGANSPCTRSKDCNPGLVCQAGVCVDPDVDAGAIEPGDASDDGG